MSKDKANLSRTEREEILRSFGFEPDGKRTAGGHEKWVHPELQQLARTHKIDPPANLLQGTGQAPWQINLNDDPAHGTWDKLTKLAKWCRDKVKEIEGGSPHEQQRLKLARDFRKAVGEYNAWKSSMRQWLRAGLDITEAPTPPMPFKELQQLNPKNQPQKLTKS